MAAIDLKLAPEISEFVRWEYYAASSDNSNNNDNNDGNNDSTSSTNAASSSLIKLPIFRRSRIETEVIVRSGETVVMGGLVTSSHSKSRSGVPLLSSLPLIGQFFRHDTVEEVRQNLIIFVTATLLSDVGEELIPLGPPEPVTSGGKVELGVPAPEPVPAEPAPVSPEPAPAAAPEAAP